MSHLAHELCGVDFLISFNKCNPLVNELIDGFKRFLKSFQISYFSNDELDFSENYLNKLRLQCIRSKIFVYFIDRFSLESNLFISNYIYAKAHNEQFGFPLMLPIVVDHDFEFSQLNHTLVEKLTSECSSVLRMMQLQTLDNLIQKIKVAINTVINTSFYENPIIRITDNFRPINSKEKEFLEKLKHSEHEILKNFILNTENIESILPKENVFLAVAVPYDELSEHLISMIHANCSLVWIDVAGFHKNNFFNFIWKKPDEILAKLSNKKPNHAKPPGVVIFYDLNTSQLIEMYYVYSMKHKWNLEYCDSYIKPTPVSNRKRRQSAKTTEIYYICQFRATSVQYLNDKDNKDLDINLNKLQASIAERKFDEYYKDAIKYNYKQLYGPLNIHPLVVNIDNDKNKQSFYMALYKPIDKETVFYIENNLNDNQVMDVFLNYTIKNLKLVYLKAFKNEKQILKFTIIFTNNPPYEGTCQLFIGLNRNELSNKIISMREKQLYPTIISNYGIMTVHGDHLFAVFFNQI